MINISGNVITAAELKTEILRRRYLSLLSKNDVSLLKKIGTI